MRRLLSLTAALALGISACGGTSVSSTTTATPEPETTTTTEPVVEAVLLSYSLAAGDEYQYEVDIDQHIEMTTSGDESLMGGEEMPGEASLDLGGTATFTHVVSEGPDPATYQVHITGKFADVRMTGTIDGQAVDSAEVPEFATLDPIDVTVVVDEKGNLIQEGNAGTEDPLAGTFAFGELGALGSGAPAPGLDPGQFIGPPFSDEEVTVGDTWTDQIETPGIGEDPIVTNISTTVTGVEDLAGTEVLVIESSSITSPIEFDLGEFFAGMFGSLLSEEATPEETAELEAMLAEFQFLMRIDDTRSDSKTWFDAAAGIARQSDTTSATNISMDLNVPDETTGEMVNMVMDMALDQALTYRLISGPTA